VDLDRNQSPNRRLHRALSLVTLLSMSFSLACAHSAVDSKLGPTEDGLASYYASSLAGNQTASGERYDPTALTAAHRTLPFGSVVRVERLDRKGKQIDGSVDVRINDRGPFVRNRIIDLSAAAAEDLGIEKVGVARVRVRIISLP
jgi:rare lipoprotein A